MNKDILLTNKLEENIKVVTKLRELLKACNSFFFSVAFITDGGLRLIEEELKMLEEKNIKGQIITSTYQSFTEPKALKKLLEYRNIELKIITENQGNHHTKGYFFEFNDKYVSLIGSSNLTSAALTKNMEWNVYKEGYLHDYFRDNLSKEFSYLWSLATKVNYIWLEKYQEIHELNKRNLSKRVEFGYKSIVTPNKMQVEALIKLESFRRDSLDKALIISATGTGKTYLAAFDVNNFNPKKCLFIVHRETILDGAMETFKRVMPNRLMGKYTGTTKDINNDFLFATIQTLSKDNNLELFESEEFDYIIFDEVHHAGATTYQKIYNYFKPKFLLGMSATPDRNDAFNIYEMFEHNIAIEIRLSKAMQFDLVCDFHYYGISDIDLIDQQDQKDVTIESLTIDERVSHIIEKSNFYGYSGTRLKGLIFCSRVEEARILSNKLNERGLKTISLSGINNENEREEAIQRLEQNIKDGNELDFILTVDIFNEGVDIPQVNQIILLRQTKSSIVFIQQIGRGLRKHFEKDFCVILDFIANYKTNYLITVALSGDKTYNKDNLRKFLFAPSKDLYGGSTIHFEEIVKDRLLSNIDKTNFQRYSLLKNEYDVLKNKVGKIPSYMDFLDYETIDLNLIIEYSKSYYNFLVRTKEIKDCFTKEQKSFLELVSMKLATGKRIEELVAIKLIIENDYDDLFKKVEKLINKRINKQTKIYLTNFLTNDFFVSSDKARFLPILIKENNYFKLSNEFSISLKDPLFKEHLNKLIDYSIRLYNEKYRDLIEENSSFVLYNKYSYDEVNRLLDWEKQIIPQNIGGYKYDENTKTFPIFINYHKEDDIQETIKYEDYFISDKIMEWFSKSNRKLKSPEIKIMEEFKENGYKFYLFVRKNKDDKEGKEFYYMGEVKPNIKTFVQDVIADGKSIVKMELDLDNPVRNDIYEYIIRG